MKSQIRMKTRRPKNTQMKLRSGFAVIEIMVSMVIMSIGLLGVAGMTVAASRRATVLSVQSTRDGIMLQEMNRLAALPYDSIASRVGCAAVASTSLPYKRCISVIDITGGAGYKRVQLIVSPTAPFARVDTVYLNRARGATQTPLAQ